MQVNDISSQVIEPRGPEPQEMARAVRPGGTYLLYAFAPGGPAVGLTADDVRATFADAFDVVGVEQGKGWPSAWYTLVRAVAFTH